MRSRHNGYRNEIYRKSYRQSASLFSSQRGRNTFSVFCPIPVLYRESVDVPYYGRNCKDNKMAERLLRELANDKREREKRKQPTWQSTLSELERKIDKAKKQLSSYTPCMVQDNHNQQRDETAIDCKNYRKTEDTSTIGSSVDKIGFTQCEADANNYQKIKSYYLSHAIPALQGKNRRALDHLNMSLKVFKIYQNICSSSYADIEELKMNFPRDKSDLGKKTLVIDIDQTLFHCEEDNQKPYDIMLPIEIQTGSVAQAYITIRPYAITFLKRMSKYYEIIAFTASHESYADVVLDSIDPGRELIKYRLYRKNCTEIHENVFAKDLRIVNRDLSSMVLIDNAPYSYILQLQNGIPVLPYYCGEDNELVHLQKYLLEMVKCHDVRQFNKKHFKFHRYQDFSDVEELARQLYLNQYLKK